MDTEAARKMFVGGIKDTNEETLKEYFDSYGDIDMVDIAYDHRNSRYNKSITLVVIIMSSASIPSVLPLQDIFSHRPKGFAIVRFANPLSVDIILEDSFHTLSNGVRVNTKRFRPPPGRARIESDQGKGRFPIRAWSYVVFVMRPQVLRQSRCAYVTFVNILCPQVIVVTI